MSKAWLFNDVSSNLFKQTYAKDFIDVSGDIYIRNGALVTTGDVSMNGNISCSSISLTTPFSSSGVNADVQYALDGKQNTFTAGTNISFDGATINATLSSGFTKISATTDAYIETQTIVGDDTGDKYGNEVSMNLDGDVMAISAPYAEYSGSETDRGEVKVYHYIGTDWVLRGTAVHSLQHASSDKQYGHGTALNGSGDVLAVSTPNANYYRYTGHYGGKVDVYTWNGTSWLQKGSAIVSGYTDYNGLSVQLSEDGNTVAVGTRRNTANVYDFTNNDWVKRGDEILTGSTNQATSQAIHTLALSGDGNRIVIGDPTYSSDKGKANAFEWTNNTWTSIGTLIGTTSGDKFGGAVALSNDGTTLVIAGWNGNSYSGYIDVKTYNGNGTWSGKGARWIGDAPVTRLGEDVAINADGSRIVGGAHYNGNATGYAEVRDYNSTTDTWDLAVARITGPASNDRLGYAVAINGSGNQFVYGAPAWGDTGYAVVSNIIDTPTIDINSNLVVAKSLYVSGSISVSGSVVHASDDRLKVDEMLIENALETIDKLKPRIYTKNNQTESGLIVQDIWYNNPELRHLVHMSNAETILDVSGEYNYDTDLTELNWNDDTVSLNYTGLIAYIVKGIQELDCALIINKANIENL